MIDRRLDELGIVLPPVSPPVGNYVGCVVQDGMVYVGGHGPIDGERVIRGKVGSALSLEDGRLAARLTALSILATLQAELGDLDRILRIVKVFGMVNVAPGFNQTPAVIDGCSDVLVEIFGEAGRHTRSAVGLAELPFDIPVEIELTGGCATDEPADLREPAPRTGGGPDDTYVSWRTEGRRTLCTRPGAAPDGPGSRHRPER